MEEQSYRVEWRIDVDAADPYRAAEFAETVMFDQVNRISLPGVFAVIDTEGNETIIDLAVGPDEN